MKSNNLATERRYHAVTLTFHSWVDPERLVSHDQTVLTNISKIKQSAAELLIKTHFANFCHRYVMLWPWPSTHWPWTFVVHRMSCVQNVYSIWVKSNNPWLSYWRFGNFFVRLFKGEGGWGPTVYTGDLRVQESNLYQIWKEVIYASNAVIQF